jgi:hypothetical protein
MSLWQRAPREVYRVYGEDEFFSEEGIDGEPPEHRIDALPRAHDSTVHRGEGDERVSEDAPAAWGVVEGGEGAGVDQDAHAHEAASRAYEHRSSGARSRLVGLALLAAVTLGVGALVLLDVSRYPVGHNLATADASSGVTRRAPLAAPRAAPPAVHQAADPERHVRAPKSPAARPPRHNRRLAGEHEETLTPSAEQLDGQTASLRTSRPVDAVARAGGEFDFER